MSLSFWVGTKLNNQSFECSFVLGNISKYFLQWPSADFRHYFYSIFQRCFRRYADDIRSTWQVQAKELDYHISYNSFIESWLESKIHSLMFCLLWTHETSPIYLFDFLLLSFTLKWVYVMQIMNPSDMLLSVYIVSVTFIVFALSLWFFFRQLF